jgi:predicted RecA/RadA family phage recombinase
MSEAKNAEPARGDRPGRDRLRRDADGRIVAVGDLVGTALAGLVAGAAVLLVFEGLMSLATLSTFGSANGWLILILPVWLFVEEFRAASYGALRVVVALLAAGFGLAAGMTAAGLAAGVPPLFSGAIGAAVFTVLYALVWFYGLWWLRHRVG